jgi:hypothetical protein
MSIFLRFGHRSARLRYGGRAVVGPKEYGADPAVRDRKEQKATQPLFAYAILVPRMTARGESSRSDPRVFNSLPFDIFLLLAQRLERERRMGPGRRTEDFFREVEKVFRRLPCSISEKEEFYRPSGVGRRSGAKGPSTIGLSAVHVGAYHAN